METIFDQDIQKKTEEKVKELIRREHEINNMPKANLILDKPDVPESFKNETPELVSEEKLVAVNTTTGSLSVVGDDDKDFDFDNIELTNEEQKEVDRMVEEADMAVASLTPKQIQDEIIKTFDFLNTTEVKILSNVLIRARNKEVFSVYAALPEKMKKYINVMCGGNASKADRNRKARDLVEDFNKNISASFTIDYMTEVLNKKKNEELKKLGQELSSGFIAAEVQRWEMYKIKADELEEKNKDCMTEEIQNTINKFRSFTEAFTESYTLSKFIEDVKAHRGKYKVKRIQLEKFTKECERFNIKYEKSKYVVKDVGTIVPIIMNLINCDELKAKLIVLAFNKYTLSYHPENPCEHIFMHYFIANLHLSVTATDEEDMKYVNKIKSSLNELAGLL